MRLPENYPDLLRAEGLTVVEIPGWKDRGRPASTGTFDPDGSLQHHTGSPDARPESTRDDKEYATWLAVTGRSDLPAPLAHTSVGRDGTVYVLAAGRANHAGKARSTGPMPAGDGNTIYIGDEAQNSGTEGWPKTQYEAMVRVQAVNCRLLHNGSTHVRAHRETSLTGKWDPGGLDMDRFRLDIAHHLAGKKAPKMTNVDQARIEVRKMIASGEQALAYLRKAGPGRKKAYAQRAAIRGSVTSMKVVAKLLSTLP